MDGCTDGQIDSWIDGQIGREEEKERARGGIEGIKQRGYGGGNAKERWGGEIRQGKANEKGKKERKENVIVHLTN